MSKSSSQNSNNQDLQYPIRANKLLEKREKIIPVDEVVEDLPQPSLKYHSDLTEEPPIPDVPDIPEEPLDEFIDDEDAPDLNHQSDLTEFPEISDQIEPTSSEKVHSKTRQVLQDLQDESRRILAYYYNPSLGALTVQNENGSVETYTGIDEQEFLHLQQTWNDNLARNYASDSDSQLNYFSTNQTEITTDSPENSTELFVLPADINADETEPDFVDDLTSKLDNHHRNSVQKTQAFVHKVINQVQSGISKGKQFFSALTDGLRSENIQEQLQGFKDNIAQKTVKLGNWIASRPDAIATRSLLTTLNDKFTQVQELTGKNECQLGNYHLSKKDALITVSNSDNQSLFTFKNENQLLTLLTKSPDFDAAQVLKQIQAERSFKQQQSQEVFSILSKVLKAKQTLNFENNGVTVNFEQKTKLMTFTSGNDKFVGRAFGKGKWEYIEGNLSDANFHNLTNTIKPSVEKVLQQQEEKRRSKETLAALA